MRRVAMLEHVDGPAWLAVDVRSGEVIAEGRARPVQRDTRRRGYVLITPNGQEITR